MKPELEAFADWLRENERSENTVDTYSRSVALFFQSFDEVTKKNMISFKRQQLNQWKPMTASNRCIALNQYCKFIGKPECMVKGIKIQRQWNTENVITLEEYEHLLECLKADAKEKLYWEIKFLAKTGARVSEFVRFERNHLKAGEVTLWTKGKFRRILIPEGLIRESKDYFARQSDSKWMFPNRYGKQQSVRGVAETIRKCEKYGIRKEVLHPHSFRHLYAIQFLKTNTNIALLADLMGHQSTSTTAIYLRLSTREQRRQLNDAMGW